MSGGKRDLRKVISDALRETYSWSESTQVTHDAVTEWLSDIRPDAAQELHLTTLRIRWASMTPRQRKRLHRLDPLLAISIRHLATDTPKEKS